MSQSEQQKQQQKVVQYLNEAHASEQALVRVLQSQIAMTPRGAYRTGAGDAPARDARPRRARRRAACRRSARAANPLMAVVGVVETVVGQALALGKTPFDLLRGSGGEEKVLKNAKDACATEALEIATYTAIERLAALGRRRRDGQAGRVDPRRRGEDARARPARDPEAHRRRRRAPTSRASRPTTSPRPARPTPSARPARPPRTRRARPPPRPSAPRARPARSRASRRPRARSRAPWPPRATSRSRATTRSPPTRSSAGWPSSRRSTWPRSTPTSASNQNRTTVLEPHQHAARRRAVGRATTSSPPPRSRPSLAEGDDDRAKQVRAYERAHKNRAGVLKAAERELATA